MPRPALPTRSAVRRVLAGATGGALAAGLLLAATAPGPADAVGSTAASAPTAVQRKANVVTPGDFTGYGFDQCLAPEQWKMDRWLQSSPFLAVGIYISGDSRGCRQQPNLTPAWVRTQLARGWRLLPITLGPQASCQPRYPRYGDDKTIIPDPGGRGRYGKARKQGNQEAVKTVGVADRLGIAPGSTLWYDLEGFDLTNTACRESALAFLSGWTYRMHRLGYRSGVYSSAGSGITMLDDARVNRPDKVRLPDQIWVARWDGKAGTSTSYLRPDGWRPHARVKQYQGGHNETWGGVTINIDRDYLDVGRGMVADPETHCGGVGISFPSYPALRPPTTDSTPPVGRVKALQCLLTEQHLYSGRLNGAYNARTVEAAEAWQSSHHMAHRPLWSRKNWMSLLSAGDKPVLKLGSTGPAVRRLQRTLNAAGPARPLAVSGLFKSDTAAALRAWQQRADVAVSGVAGTQTWGAISRGSR